MAMMHSTPPVTHPPAPPLWKAFLHYLFGSFNGIQVFLYPSLLVYWLKGDTLVGAAYDLMGTGLHLMPLSIFLALFLFILFMVIKYHHLNIYHLPLERSEAAVSIIRIHKHLLAVLLSYAVFFVLSIFLKYFYGIKIQVGGFAAQSSRILACVWIMYVYLKNVWISPWQRCGYSLQQSQLRALVYPRLHPYKFIAFNLYLVITVFILAKLYTSIMEFIYHPLFSYFALSTGILPQFQLLPINSILPLLINLIFIALAFLISNLFFIPLVWLAKFASQIMHPIRIQRSKPTLQEQSDNAQT